MTGPSQISSGTTSLPIQKISADHSFETQDPVVIEEPLEIILEYGPTGARSQQPISVTMRTPGQDAELAIGFLFTEGILSGKTALAESPGGQENHSGQESHRGTANTIHIPLSPAVTPDLKKLQRHFYTSSSCGVCGKTSIESLYTIHPPKPPATGPHIDAELLYHLPESLRKSQDLFDSTGGLHAAGLFDQQGNLQALREDVGRHNALDKLIGYALLQDLLPLDKHILLLSGRACFELIQKAAMAGITIIAAVGPPSSLAVQLARDGGITLVGFLREQRFNIYSGAHRIHI